MEENINERLSELGTKILATTRNELYIHMRFLDVALSSFAYVIDPSVMVLERMECVYFIIQEL